MITVFVTTKGKKHQMCIDASFLSSIGVPESDPNKEIISLFVASWFSLLADSPLKREQKPWSAHLKLRKLLRDKGVKGTILFLSDIAHRMVSNTTFLGTDDAIIIDSILHDMKDTPVFQEYLHLVRFMNSESSLDDEVKRTEIESVYSWLYTFLNFGKKLDYVDPRFDEVALRGWLDIESRLRSIEYAKDELSFLDSYFELFYHVSDGTILDQSLVLVASRSGESWVGWTNLGVWPTTLVLIGSYLEANSELLDSSWTTALGWIRFYLIQPDGRRRVVYRLGQLS